MDSSTENSPGINIGVAHSEELDSMLRIMCDGFGLPFEAAREIFYKDPYFRQENKLVLRADGEVASCLTIVDTECWMGRGMLRLGGIAGVSTRKDMRNHGYAARLLRAAIATLHARGYAIAALFPFSQQYYRQFGWELVGYAHRYATAPANLPPYPEAKHVRLARPEDVADLVQLYSRHAEGRPLHCPRDAKRWQYILEHAKQRVVFAHHAEPAEGFILYEHRSRQGEPLPPDADHGPTVRILEMVASTARARRGLVGHLAAQTNAACIEYTTSWQQLHDTGLLRLSVQVAQGTSAVAAVESVPGAMVRVIDMERIADGLRPEWRGFNGAVALRVNDTLLGPGITLVTVIGTGEGEPDVADETPLPGIQDFENIVEGDVTTWSQVVTGYLSSEDAFELGLLRSTTLHARDLAAELFPRRLPFLPAPDHF